MRTAVSRYSSWGFEQQLQDRLRPLPQHKVPQQSKVVLEEREQAEQLAEERDMPSLPIQGEDPDERH